MVSSMKINNINYKITRYLGKGKSGYYYLGEKDGKPIKEGLEERVKKCYQKTTKMFIVIFATLSFFIIFINLIIRLIKNIKK